MKKYIGILLAFLLFTACKNNDGLKEYKGTYTEGHEVAIFTDENTKQDYWLDGDKKIINDLNERTYKIRETTGEPYPTVKVKLIGKDIGKATNGLADENDRVLEVHKCEILDK